MRTKGMQRRLASLLSFVMLLGSLFNPEALPVYAVDAEDVLSGEEYSGEGTTELEMPETVSEDESAGEVEQCMSLKDLAEEYTVTDVLQGQEYKIIYVSENGVSLRKDNEEQLEDFGNDRVFVGEDGQLVQTFEKGSEDTLAPMIYYKDGYSTRRASRWKVFYIESIYIPGYWDEYYDEYVYEHWEYVTRTRTLSANTAVKTLERYASGGIIRLYPNWESVEELSLDFHSNLDPDEVKSITVKHADDNFSVPGNRDQRLEYSNDGFMVVSWNTAPDGSGEDTIYRHTDIHTEELFDIATVDEGTWNLSLYGQWEVVRYGISFDPNSEMLSQRAEQADDEAVIVNEAEQEKTYFAWNQNVSVNAYTADHFDYEMTGWAFTADAEEAVISVDDLSSMSAEDVFLLKEASPVADDEEDFTLYAFWDYHKYNISYRGIRVLSVNAVSGEETISSDTASVKTPMVLSGISEYELERIAAERGVFLDEDLAEYEILGVEETPAISMNLPTAYNIGEELVLPGPDDINAGNTDPEFSKDYDFICWTKNKWRRQDVRSLGKNGDIHDGDVLLYAVYIPKNMTASVNEGQHAVTNEFKAIQVNTPNLLDASDYAVINLVGNNAHADMLSVTFDNGKKETDYFELCVVDSTKAALGQGYATIGIRLKDSVSADKINEARKKNNLILLVRGVNDPIGSEQKVKLKLRTYYNYPKFKLNRSEVKINPDLVGESGSAEIFLTEVSGSLVNNLLYGSWELDYVDASKKNVSKDVILSVTGSNTIRMVVSKVTEAKGYIRLRNCNWIDDAYTYISLKILTDKKLAMNLSTDKVILNNAYDTEEEFISVSYAGGMTMDASKLKLTTDKKWPEKGLTASIEEGMIRIRGAKNVKKGSYKLKVSCEGMKDKKIVVSVMNTKPEKALKFVVSGKADAVFGGQVFLKPVITGFSGQISSVRVVKESNILSKENPELKRYEAEWNGNYVVLSATDDYLPYSKKLTETIEITLSTGRKLTAGVTIKPTKGLFVLSALNVVLSGNSVTTPVMATYTWKFYYGPNTFEKRVVSFDMTKPEVNKVIKLGDKKGELTGLSKKGVYSGSYENGIITLTLDPSYKADKKKTFDIKVPAVWSVTGNSYNARFKLTIPQQ